MLLITLIETDGIGTLQSRIVHHSWRRRKKVDDNTYYLHHLIDKNEWEQSHPNLPKLRKYPTWKAPYSWIGLPPSKPIGPPLSCSWARLVGLLSYTHLIVNLWKYTQQVRHALPPRSQLALAPWVHLALWQFCSTVETYGDFCLNPLVKRVLPLIFLRRENLKNENFIISFLSPFCLSIFSKFIQPWFQISHLPFFHATDAWNIWFLHSIINCTFFWYFCGQVIITNTN